MESLVLVGATLIDGTGAEPVRGRAVVVEQGRIAQVVDISRAPRARRIDLEGHTLLPGLINCHVHLCLGAEADPVRALKDDPAPLTALKALRRAQETVEAGVTTVRDLGGREYVELAVRRAIAEGHFPGPRILAAGRPICMTGGHGSFLGREADGPDDARKAVREQLKAGADVIKLIATGGVMTPGVEPGSSQLTLEEMRAAIDEARKAGRRTAAHAQGSTGIADAIEAGITTIEHGIYLTDEIIASMKAKGVFLVPTLAAPAAICGGGLAAGIPEFMVRKSETVAAHQSSRQPVARARAHDQARHVPPRSDPRGHRRGCAGARPRERDRPRRARPRRRPRGGGGRGRRAHPGARGRPARACARCDDQIAMMTLRPAAERGHFDHGWLDTYHTFSFASYHDPKHMGFRSLRVINDDRVQPGEGFGTHGHRDMEIITWVLEGALEHKDSMGNGSVIVPGDLQRMSAGSGVTHSEFNPSREAPVHLLQIWLLPSARGLAPSYEQKRFEDSERRGRLRLLAARDGRDGAVTIHQDALVWTALLEPGEAVRHALGRDRHAWVHVARGAVSLNGVALGAGGGAALSEEAALDIRASAPAEVLLFD